VRQFKKVLLVGITAALAVSTVTVAGALISGTTGSQVTRLTTPPLSVRLNALQSPTQVYAFDEAQNVTLASPVAVDATAAGTYSTFPNGSATIAKNTVVDSHLIHSDITASNYTIHRTGSVTFGGDILGVVASTARLVASDTSLGIPGTLYERTTTNPSYAATQYRGLESSNNSESGSVGSDKFTITGRTVSFDLNTLIMDEIRVITVHTNPLATTVVGTPDPVQAGNNVMYTITVTNNGPSSASNVQVQDQFPGATLVSATPAPQAPQVPGSCTQVTTTVTCPLGNISAGGSASATVVVKSPDTVPTGGKLTNTASSPPGQSPTTAMTTVQSPQLDTTITDSPDPVQAGHDVTYTLKVTNNGIAPVAHATVVDTLPANTALKLPLPLGCTGTGPVTCDLGPLTNVAPNNFATVAITVTTPLNAVGNITDTAIASPGTNTSASESTTVRSPQLNISITDSPDPVQAGHDVTYTLKITNNGIAQVADPVVVDTLPANTTLTTPLPAGCTGTGPVTCHLSPLDPNAFATVALTVTTPSDAAGNITDTATASPGTNATASESTVVLSPQLDTTITDSPDPVQQGYDVTYTLKVTNNGIAPVADAQVVNTLPASTALKLPLPLGCTGTGPVTCDLGPLTNAAPNNFASVAITVTTASNAVVTDSATALPGTNNVASENTSVVSPVLDTAIVASPDPAVTAGDDVQYTLTVTNNGLSPVADAHVFDTLPSGTTLKQVVSSPNGCNGTAPVDCDLGGLDLGAANAKTVKLLVTSPGTVPDGGGITDTATASPGTNNNASVFTTVEPFDPSVSKGFVLPGGSLGITDSKGNTGTVSLPGTGDGAPVIITQGVGSFCNGPCTGPVTTIDPVPGYLDPKHPLTLTQVYNFKPEDYPKDGFNNSLTAAAYTAFGSTIFKLLDQVPNDPGHPVPKCLHDALADRTAADYPPVAYACDAYARRRIDEIGPGQYTATLSVDYLSSDGSVGHH
jgi:uncharacterized repeat protein (TIGR01451 family)